RGELGKTCSTGERWSRQRSSARRARQRGSSLSHLREVRSQVGRGRAPRAEVVPRRAQKSTGDAADRARDPDRGSLRRPLEFVRRKRARCRRARQRGAYSRAKHSAARAGGGLVQQSWRLADSYRITRRKSVSRRNPRIFRELRARTKPRTWPRNSNRGAV